MFYELRIHGRGTPATKLRRITLIKRASLEDVETILHLQMRVYLSEAEIFNDYSIHPLIETLKEIEQEFSRQVFLKATEEDGNIIGSVRASSIFSFSCITCLMYSFVSSFSNNTSTPLLSSNIFGC
jgi:hypothetical protein